jgi:hypothetical protein
MSFALSTSPSSTATTSVKTSLLTSSSIVDGGTTSSTSQRSRSRSCMRRFVRGGLSRSCTRKSSSYVFFCFDLLDNAEDCILQLDGVISPEAAKAVRDDYKASLNAALTDVASYVPPPVRFEGAWKGMVWPASPDARQYGTGVSDTVLKEVGKASVHVPGGFVSAINAGLLSYKNNVCARHRKYIHG